MLDLLRRAEDLDATDPLARYRDRFVITDPDTIYLDGNSLGRLPKATRYRLRHAVEVEWGSDLIRGWDRWIELGREAGDVLAGLVSPGPGSLSGWGACTSPSTRGGVPPRSSRWGGIGRPGSASRSGPGWARSPVSPWPASTGRWTASSGSSSVPRRCSAGTRPW